MIENPISHRHTGHCESGVTSILLEQAGLNISEAMVLGLSSGLTFAHFPFIRINQLPLTTYRMPPRAMYRGLGKRLGIRWSEQRFRDPQAGMQALDDLLAAGHILGVQASVYWLPYFPKAMRFHFNGHNLIVYGKDGDEYLISDPVFGEVKRCPSDALRQARFVRGAMAPKGLLYRPEQVPSEIDLAKLAPQAITRTSNMMLRAPFPFVGTSAIRMLAKKIAKIERAGDEHYTKMYLGQVVRMQEEIGTGGGGFRFMYAAFLREVGEALNSNELLSAADDMTEIGDAWRVFALQSAKQIRCKSGMQLDGVREALFEVAEFEQRIFNQLLQIARTLPRCSL